jgi:hypothetical protein
MATLTNGGIVMILLFGVGLVLLFSAIAKKHAGPLKHFNPVLGAVLGVALIIPGFYWGVAPNLPGFEDYGGVQPTTVVVTTPTTNVAVPTFEITPVKNTTGFNLNSTLNSAGTDFTFPFVVTSLDKTDDAAAANSNAVLCRCTFKVTPVAPAGADSTDLATLYYSVTPTNYEVDSDDHYLLMRSNDAEKNPILNWTVDLDGAGAKGAVPGYEGEKSTSMLLTDSGNIWLDFVFANQTIAKYFTTLNGIDFTVTFHNEDYSWSDTFTVTAIKISDGCSNT